MFTTIASIIISLGLTLTTVMDNAGSKSIYDFKVNTIDGKPFDLKTLKGKKLLIVNVASKCGYTPQYADLEKLHKTYGNKLVVMGFPANNFGSQEPGSNSEIQEFCKKNYGVTFLMFEKISVKGKDRHPLYEWLEEKTGKVPTWNFCKYLVDEKGETVQFFPSSTNPMSDDIVKKL